MKTANANQPIYFTHREHLTLLYIVRTVRKDAIKRRNKPEAKLMTELSSQLLDYLVYSEGTYVELDRMVIYNLQVCVERYIDHCVNTRNNDDYMVAVSIADKLTA